MAEKKKDDFAPVEIALDKVSAKPDREMGDVHSLAESIRKLGLLQPLILEATANGRYKVIDGRRRYFALLELGRKTLAPWEWTWNHAGGHPEIVALAANTERRDLSPSEELAKIAQLADGYTVEKLAELLGKSPGWVSRRLKIKDLNEGWREVLDDPELSKAWSLEKLALIARQPEYVQEELEYMINEPPLSFEALKKEIDEESMKLSAADFDTSECENCVHNSALQRLLFDDGEEACCLNAECWAKKEEEALKAWERERERERSDRSDESDGSDGGNPAPRGEGEKKEPTVKEREFALEGKRLAHALAALRAKIEEKGFAEAFLAETRPDGWIEEHFIRCLSLWGYHGPFTNFYRLGLTPAMAVKPAPLEPFLVEFYEQLCRVVGEDLRKELQHTQAALTREGGPAVCALFGLDWQHDFWEPAMVAIPEPKSLIEARRKEKK